MTAMNGRTFLRGLSAGWLSGMLLSVAMVAQAASREWTGAGVGDDWSTAENWKDSQKPAANDTAVFGGQGMGRNVVDEAWTLSGLTYTNSSKTAGHLTDLDGNRLIVSGTLGWGTLNYDTRAAISNGTLQLGTGSLTADLLDGLNAHTNGCTELTVYGTVDAVNLRDVRVGYNQGTVQYPQATTGVLDLGSAVIVGAGVPNSFVCRDLTIGQGHTAGYGDRACGVLRLPPSVTNITVRDFRLARARSRRGTLDLGENSQLRSFTCANFYMGHYGHAEILGWPRSVNMTVGTPSSPGRMYVGVDSVYRPTHAELAISNAAFVAYLTELCVGDNNTSGGMAPSSCTGRLDLAHATVQIGNTPNQVKLTKLSLAGNYQQHARNILGELKLPPAVNSIEADTLVIGNSGWYERGSEKAIATAILDLGSGSQLTNLAANTTFFFGKGCRGYINGLPEGVHIRVGRPEVPATVFSMASNETRPSHATLTPTNGSFSLHVRDFDLGMGEDLHCSPRLGLEGRLDLRETEVRAFVVTNNAFVGAHATVANLYGRGYLHLPACDASVSNTLMVGDTGAGSLGVLELEGTRLAVGRRLEVGPTGCITTRVLGASCGLDFRSSETNDFALATGAVLHLAFDASPLADPSAGYWGLRVAGDARSHLQQLTVAPARLTWSTDGLNPAESRRVGIHYSAKGDYTYVGLAPPTGTMMMVR